MTRGNRTVKHECNRTGPPSRHALGTRLRSASTNVLRRSRMRTSMPLADSGLLVMAMLAGCSRDAEKESAPAAAPASAAPATVDWPTFVDSFIEARFKTDPYFAVQSGRHEYDGKMPDWSRAALDANVSELRTFAGKLAKWDPVSLSNEQRFEHEHLQW